ncbi:MAG: transposase [Gemmatimonadetes bacterium]|nr:transposase [Gemmatimonadota bacterium]
MPPRRKDAALSVQPKELDRRARAKPGVIDGKWCDEYLAVNWFTALRDAQRCIEAWRHVYITIRPHDGLASHSPMDALPAQYRARSPHQLTACVSPLRGGRPGLWCRVVRSYARNYSS